MEFAVAIEISLMSNAYGIVVGFAVIRKNCQSHYTRLVQMLIGSRLNGTRKSVITFDLKFQYHLDLFFIPRREKSPFSGS